MIDFKEENRDSLERGFIAFYNTVEYFRQDNNDMPIGTIAKKYVDNEIAMKKGMQEYYDYLKEENRKNQRLLNAIKKVKGKTFYKYLLDIIEESEGIKGLAQIVKEPIGTFQKENYGRQINGIWVDQWSVGMEGDSYEGFVCVQLKSNKFLKFGYSM